MDSIWVVRLDTPVVAAARRAGARIVGKTSLGRVIEAVLG